MLFHPPGRAAGRTRRAPPLAAQLRQLPRPAPGKSRHRIRARPPDGAGASPAATRQRGRPQNRARSTRSRSPLEAAAAKTRSRSPWPDAVANIPRCQLLPSPSPSLPAPLLLQMLPAWCTGAVLRSGHDTGGGNPKTRGEPGLGSVATELGTRPRRKKHVRPAGCPDPTHPHSHEEQPWARPPASLHSQEIKCLSRQLIVVHVLLSVCLYSGEQWLFWGRVTRRKG